MNENQYVPIDNSMDNESYEFLKKVIKTIEAGRHILLHGMAGVGKSWTIKRIVNYLESQSKKVYVTALTGVAALGLCDENLKVMASTLHRFGGIGVANLSAETLASRLQSQAIKRWRKCEILIIDEVSMLGGGLFEKICTIAKIVRKSNIEPMGGIQLICSGDFFQLPPVKDKWVFQSKEWDALNIRPFIMETPYRFNDKRFFELLLRARKGHLTIEDCDLLNKRVGCYRRLSKMIQKMIEENPGEVIKPTMFFSRRNDVDNYNMRELDKLPGTEVVFQAIDSFEVLKGKPIKDDYMRILDDNAPIILSFKVGSQVMLKINLDVSLGLVNGSRGVVSEIIPNEAMIVKFLSLTLRVEMYKYKIEDKYAIATRTQIPFILADSCTIHKSQGSTLDFIVVDSGPSVFEEGQAYVALSRCRNLKGLLLSEFVPTSIKCNRNAFNYVKVLEEKAKREEDLYDAQNIYVNDLNESQGNELQMWNNHIYNESAKTTFSYK